jgi:hypothetical protein
MIYFYHAIGGNASFFSLSSQGLGWRLAHASQAFRFRFPVDLELIHLGTGVISPDPFPTVQGKTRLALNSLVLLPFRKKFLGFSPGLFGSVDGRLLDLLDVENILFPARSQFVSDQVFP